MKLAMEFIHNGNTIASVVFILFVGIATICFMVTDDTEGVEGYD